MTIKRTQAAKDHKKKLDRLTAPMNIVHAPKFIFQLVHRKCTVSFWQFVLSVYLGHSFMALLDDAIFKFTPHSRHFQAMYDANPTWAGDFGIFLYISLALLLSYGIFRIIGAIRD